MPVEREKVERAAGRILDILEPPSPGTSPIRAEDARLLCESALSLLHERDVLKRACEILANECCISPLKTSMPLWIQTSIAQAERELQEQSNEGR